MSTTLEGGWLTSVKDSCYTLVYGGAPPPQQWKHLVKPSKGMKSFVVSNSNLDEFESKALLRKRRGDTVPSSSNGMTTTGSADEKSAEDDDPAVETAKEAKRLARKVGKIWPDAFYEKTIHAVVHYMILDVKGEAYWTKIRAARRGQWDMSDRKNAVRPMNPLEQVRVPSTAYIKQLFKDSAYVQELLKWSEYYATRPECEMECLFIDQMMTVYVIHLNSSA